MKLGVWIGDIVVTVICDCEVSIWRVVLVFHVEQMTPMLSGPLLDNFVHQQYQIRTLSDESTWDHTTNWTAAI